MSRSAVIIMVLAMCGLVVVSQLYVPVPLIGDVGEEYGVPVALAGLVLTAFGIAYAGGFLVFGPLSDGVGRKVVMVPGLLALAVASVLVAFAPSFGTLVGARVLQGFVAAALPPVALAYLPEALPQRLTAFGIAAMSTAFLVAGLLGQVYGGLLGSLSTAVLILAAVYVVGALLIAFLPEDREGEERSLGGVFSIYQGLPSLLTNGSLLRAYFGALVLLFSFVAFYTALQLELGEVVRGAGLDLTTVRAIAVPAMFLPLIAAFFIQKFGPRMVVCVGLAVGALGLFGAAAAGDEIWFVVAASVVFVAGISVTVPSLIALVSSLASEHTGMAISLYTFVLFVGASLGPQMPPLAGGLGFAGICLVLGGALTVASAANAFAGAAEKQTGEEPEEGQESEDQKAQSQEAQSSS